MYNCSASLRASIRSLLLPFLTAFFRVLHTRTSVTRDFSRSYNQVAQVPSSKTTRKSPRSPSMNCRRVLPLVSMTPSITIFPREFLTAIDVLSVCTSIPIYLTLVIKGCSFPDKFEQTHSNRTPKGRPFYNVLILARGNLPVSRRDLSFLLAEMSYCSAKWGIRDPNQSLVRIIHF